MQTDRCPCDVPACFTKFELPRICFGDKKYLAIFFNIPVLLFFFYMIGQVIYHYLSLNINYIMTNNVKNIIFVEHAYHKHSYS